MIEISMTHIILWALYRVWSKGWSTDKVWSKIGFVQSHCWMTRHFVRLFILQRSIWFKCKNAFILDRLKLCRIFSFVCLFFFLLEDCGVLQSYRINSCPRGKCIVINNVTFDSETSERVGAQHDEGRLKDLFEELGFLVEIKTNLTRDDMYKLAKDVAAEDHSNFDGFVLIIMSHGGEGNVVCGIDGRAARIEEIMVEFKAISCETLRNKPKMFFIQCCRGECAEFMSPVQRHVDNPMPRFSNDSALANNPCPQEGDFLLSFAAAPGYYAYRRPDSGSVFLQVGVKEFCFTQFHHLVWSLFIFLTCYMKFVP